MLLALTESVVVVFLLMVTLAGCTVIAGAGSIVTVAEPPAVPLQKESLIAVTVYVVVLPGLTLREAVVPEDTCCVNPSDQVTFTG